MLKFVASLAAVFLVHAASSASALTITAASSSSDAAITGGINNGDSGTTAALGGVGGTILEEAGGAGWAYGSYMFQAWADTYGGNEDHTFIYELTTTFTVTPDNAGTVYDLTLHTERHGGLGIADDTWSNSTIYSSADLGVLAGSVNGSVYSELGLSGQSGPSGTNDQTDTVNQVSSALSFTGLSGVTVWDVVTTWSVNVTSNYDESGVGMGQSADWNSPGSGLYYLDIPATGGDGVYTTADVTITAIPEPTTALLLGLGLLGIGFRRQR